jgi:hypothetical protein
MTLNELKKKVAESDHKEEFDKRRLDIKLHHINYSVPLVGIVAIYEFLLKQQALFNKYDNLPSELNQIKKTINSILNSVVKYVEAPHAGPHELSNSLSYFQRSSATIFLPDTPEFEFLVDVFKMNSEFYAGAFQFLTGNTGNSGSKPHFMGYLLAYEFTTKNSSLITERKNAEKKSIASIRNDFQESLANAQQQLTNYLADTKQQSDENANSIIKFKNDKEDEFYKWYDKAVQDYDTFTKSSAQKIIEFEELYKEKLKLEAPAKYWSERAGVLRKTGNKWLLALVASIVLGIILLTTVLMLISTGELDKIFSKTPTAIKWSIVFITLVSFIAFAIRIFSKLTFSSYHLVRDAEEREQLTYVYLALQKEKGIDQTERHLIMQSIFSRADSGLLKDDGGPTMPGNIVDQVVKK